MKKGTYYNNSVSNAESKEQAKEFVEKHCGLVLGGDIHTTLPESDVDWVFNVHPEKIVK